MFAMTTPLNRELSDCYPRWDHRYIIAADDIHRLAALSQFELDRTADDTKAVARALVNIDLKIKRLGLKQDTNWDDRWW